MLSPGGREEDATLSKHAHEHSAFCPASGRIASGKRRNGMYNVVITGTRLPTGRPIVVVWIERQGDSLRMRPDLRNHSPAGPEWGYEGSGPAQLALAVLAEVLGDDVALAHYQAFKREVIARLDWHGWRLTAVQVWDWFLSGACVGVTEEDTVDLMWEGDE